MNYKNYVLFIITIILIQCNKNESGYDKATNFYINNKNNDSLEIFSKTIIRPFRDLYRINSNIYFEEYDISSIDKLYNQSNNKKSMLYPYLKLHLKDKDKILNYIHQIYSNYKKLKVLAIYGQNEHIEFILTPKDVLLFYSGNNKFDKEKYIHEYGLKNVKFIYIDENWIYYELSDDSGYDFRG